RRPGEWRHHQGECSMTMAVSEAASENPRRRRRGRPGVNLFNSADPTVWKRRDFADLSEGSTHSFMQTEAKTRRGWQNSEYAWVAAHVLFGLLDEYPEVVHLTGIEYSEVSGDPGLSHPVFP